MMVSDGRPGGFLPAVGMTWSSYLILNPYLQPGGPDKATPLNGELMPSGSFHALVRPGLRLNLLYLVDKAGFTASSLKICLGGKDAFGRWLCSSAFFKAV
jgi:hypothetical protein